MADEVSHADIYRALGILEGKLDSMSQALTRKHTDLSSAFSRINSLEKTVWVGVGIAMTCSVVIPLLITALSPRLHFGHTDAPTALVR